MIGGGITNTLDILGGQKIQDYLGGAGTATKGPGGGTLYTGGGSKPRTYQGDSKYGSLVNEYFGSNFYKPTNHMGQAQFEDPLFGSYSSQSGAGVYGQGFMDYLQNAQEKMMMEMTNRRAKSPEEMQRYALIGEAHNKMFPGGNAFYEAGVGSVGGAPQGMNLNATGQILGPDGKPMQPFTGDTSPVGGPAIDFNEPIGSPANPFGPQQPIYAATGVDTTSEYSNLDILNPNYIPGSNPFDPSAMPEHNMRMPDGFKPGTDTTDSFGIGSNPIMNNPIAPMPNMPTAPNTQPGHSHDDLLSGIGKLFEQYFPQQGSQQINQPSPMFDAAGNSVPDGQTQSSQVFGNMITPNFGGGY